MINLHPILSKEQHAELTAAAEQDGHRLILPTHRILKDGKVIGSLSLASLPVTAWWLDSKLPAADSLRAIHLAENVGRCQGQNFALVACSENSPYFDHMTKHLGYEAVLRTVLFHKSLL